ncbi:MAG: hypothetical protein ACYC9P_09455 [Rudaea sp.]
MNEGAEFAKRLATAMRAMGFEARPSVLLARFNTRYDGRGVSFTTASRWLSGESIPEQDKLVVLAREFRVEPHALRYGEKGRSGMRESHPVWPDRVSPRDQAMFEDFLALPAKQREAVRSLIESLIETVRKQKPQ